MSTPELVSPPDATATGGEHVRGFFGRDLVYTFLWASQMGLSTALTAVVTRVLGPSHYGVAAASITIMQLVSAVGGFGLQIGIQRAHAHRGDEAARKLVSVACLFAIVTFVIVGGSGPLWAHAVGFSSFRGALSYALLWAALTAATNGPLGLLRSRDQLSGFVVVNLLQTALAELLSLALIVVVANSAANYILGEMIGQAAALLVGLALVPPLMPGRADFGFIKDTLKFCAPLVPTMVAIFILSASDRLVVNAYVGHDALGRYAVAANIGSIPAILITSLASSWVPRVFSMSGSEDLTVTLRRTRDILYVLLIPMVVAIGVASPILLRLWAPHSFGPDGLQLEVALIVAAAIPFAATTTHERILLARERTRSTAIATSVAAGFNLVLNLILVPAIGILGAAISTLLALCLMDLILVRASAQVAPMPRPRNVLLVWIFGGSAVLFGAVLLPTSVPFLLIRAGAAGAMGLSTLLLVRSLVRSEDGALRTERSFMRWFAVRADLDA